MAPVDFCDLVDRVVDTTRLWDAEGFVALYAFGSFVRDDLDEWSDLDVCLMRKNDALSYARGWMAQMYDAFGFKVDAIALSLANIGEQASWDVSCFLRGLRENSKLLLGEDVRALIRMPSEHKLRLSVSWVALSCVRRLYSIRREDPLPESLSVPDIFPSRPLAGGNIAWQVATTVVQLLRGIVFLETGVLCEGKSQIYGELRRWGDKSLVSHCTDAIELRREVPRFAPLEQVPPRLSRLRAVLPKLVSRLFMGLAAHGLKDPSYEPSGPLYRPDGRLRPFPES